MKIITAKGFWAQIPRLEIAQNVIRKNRLKIKSLGPRSTCQKCLQDKNQGPKIQANAWWQHMMFPNGRWCQLVPSDACPFFPLSHSIAPVVRLLSSHFWTCCPTCQNIAVPKSDIFHRRHQRPRLAQVAAWSTFWEPTFFWKVFGLPFWEPLFLESFWVSILGTTFIWKVFGFPFWKLFLDSFWASILGTTFLESFWASILGTTFFWKVFGLPFWEPTGKMHGTKEGSSGQVQCSDQLQNIFHGIVIVSPSTCHVWYVWITKHSKPLPKIKSKVWGFGIPKVTKMKSHGLRLAILLTRQRMPKIKSQDLHSNHRFIMEIKSLGLASNIFSWFETVVWIKSLDPTSNLPRLKSLERF